MIKMKYISADGTQKSLNVIELYSVYKNNTLYNDGFDYVSFKIKSNVGNRNILYTNSNFYSKDSQYIRINDTVFKLQEIIENPDRIYSLIQQDILKDSIDNLP